MINVKFHQLIHMIAQLVAAQAEHGASITPSFEAIRVGHFTRLNSLTFMSVKVEEDPQGFLYDMKNILGLYVTRI